MTALFPEDCVQKRASLTEKALAYGEGGLGGNILYLFEYRGGKDARYLTRLQQSEGEIAHEYTTVAGRRRETRVARREGSPVVVTTTTDKVVYPDDETRFLSLGADDSDELTRQIVRQRLLQHSTTGLEPKEIVWGEATRLIAKNVRVFCYPPWFGAVAERIPVDETRARRNVDRFCSLLEAVALCRSFSDRRREECRKELKIAFTDYCVA